VIGCSIDSQFSHLAWKKVEPSKGGIGDIPYPLLADISKNIAADYGVLMDIGIALRGTFLIDKEGIVQHESVNNLPLGRNIEEFLRLVDALQFHEEVGEVCPANWKKGALSMKPDLEGSKEYFEAANK
jgi:peroxiredoxin (alkyl hydroperoxide reductase subunit C)